MSDRPKMCARCGKLMGLTNKCPYCGADNSKLGMKLRRLASAGADDGGGLTVTTTLIIINVFLFATVILVAGTGSGSSGMDILTPDIVAVFRLGMQDNSAIAAGAWWRLITANYLHLGLLHVGFNCYVLYFTGQLVEAEFGGRLMFLLYTVSGLGATAASYYAGLNGAGASGAVCGLVGVILVRRRLVDGDLSHPITRAMLRMVVMIAIISILPRINAVAHLFGFLAGGAATWALTRLRFGRRGAVVVMLATVGSVIITLVAAGMMLYGLLQGGPYDFRDASACWLDDVAPAVAKGGYDPGTAKTAEKCLDGMADLEGPANDARDRAVTALEDGRQAWEEGNRTGVREAYARLARALNDARGWLAAAAPRYGWTGPPRRGD